MVCVIFFGIGVSIDAIIVHIVPHAIDLGVSTISAARLLAIIGGIGITGRIGMGTVSDKIGSKRALIICLITLPVALFWLLGAKDLWMLYIFAGIFGFGYGGGVAMLSPVVAAMYGLSSHGIILGVAFFAATIGGAISPLIAGRVFDMTGSYISAFLGIAVFGVVCVVLALLLKMPYKAN